MAETFFGKNITFPLNPLSACPKSRCNLVSSMSNTTVTSLLSGVPLFDLFTQVRSSSGSAWACTCMRTFQRQHRHRDIPSCRLPCVMFV